MPKSQAPSPRDDLAIRAFLPSDVITVNDWLMTRKLPLFYPHDVPRIGFIAYYPDPICAGFMRECEGKIGILDSFVTDPRASLFKRHKAIEAIVDKLIAQAKTEMITRLLCFTVDKGIVKRATNRGFSKLPHLVMSREII